MSPALLGISVKYWFLMPGILAFCLELHLLFALESFS